MKCIEKKESVVHDFCENKIEELGLKDHVYFAGKVNDEKMAECLNAADIYITTSQSDGTSASMLEAMACGLPVIVSNAPAYYEWVEDGVNGFIVPRGDSEALTKHLCVLLSNQKLCSKMGQRNLQIARQL